MATVNLFGDLALDDSVQETNDKLTALTATRDTAIGASQNGVVSLAVRRDEDTASVVDGNLTALAVDEEGRLKTSNKTGSFSPITGAASTLGATVSVDVRRASNVVMHVKNTGTVTMAAGLFTFEGSLDSTDGANGTWFGIQAVRSNSNIIESVTTAITPTVIAGAGAAYSWEASVNAFQYMRVRCSTAVTSGAIATWIILRGSYATEPIPAAQASVAAQPISGSVTMTTTTVSPVVPTTPYFVNSLATTNGALILTGTSGLQAFYATNEGATVAYVKLYNKAAAPTVGTDVPEMTIPIPAAVSGVPGVYALPIGFSGFRFLLGLGIAITGAAIYTDTTAVAAGQVKVKLSRTA